MIEDIIFPELPGNEVIERLKVIEDNVSALHGHLARIEAKVDSLILNRQKAILRGEIGTPKDILGVKGII